MPMQLTEQYVSTSCSAVLCCETEMTVCRWSMCFNSSVQIRGNKQLEVLWADKTLPLMSLRQCCLPFTATLAVCVGFSEGTTQHSPSQAARAPHLQGKC